MVGPLAWLLYLIGIGMIIMGILGILNKPIEFTPKEPTWHAIVKIIVGLIVIYAAYV